MQTPKGPWSREYDFGYIIVNSENVSDLKSVIFEIRSVEERSKSAFLPEKKQAPNWREVSASRRLSFFFF